MYTKFFDNINPEEYNSSLGISTSSSNSNSSSSNNQSSTSTSSSSSKTVYWTPNGKSYHTTKSCSTLSRSKNILEGTITESGKSDPCDRCH